MTPEQFQELAEKAKNNTITQEEELLLLEELNKGTESLRELIRIVKENK